MIGFIALSHTSHLNEMNKINKIELTDETEKNRKEYQAVCGAENYNTQVHSEIKDFEYLTFGQSQD